MTMDELLSPADVALDLRASDKAGALRDLSARLGAKVNVDPDAILAAMLKREELGSTGMGDGIAIPHARVSEVRRPAAVLARLKHKIPFDAVDGQPVELVCMLVLPADPQSGQLNALAKVARALRNPDVRACLRTVRDGNGAVQALVQAESAGGT